MARKTCLRSSACAERQCGLEERAKTRTHPDLGQHALVFEGLCNDVLKIVDAVHLPITARINRSQAKHGSLEISNNGAHKPRQASKQAERHRTHCSIHSCARSTPDTNTQTRLKQSKTSKRTVVCSQFQTCVFNCSMATPIQTQIDPTPSRYESTVRKFPSLDLSAAAGLKATSPTVSSDCSVQSLFNAAMPRAGAAVFDLLLGRGRGCGHFPGQQRRPHMSCQRAIPTCRVWFDETSRIAQGR